MQTSQLLQTTNPLIARLLSRSPYYSPCITSPLHANISTIADNQPLNFTTFVKRLTMRNDYPYSNFFFVYVFTFDFGSFSVGYLCNNFCTRVYQDLVQVNISIWATFRINIEVLR